MEKTRIKIIYEDIELLVIDKPHGLLSVSSDGTANAFDIMKKFIRASDSHSSLYVTHRIDRDTSGVLLFCKSKELRDALQDNWNGLVSERLYCAVAEGIFKQKQGVFTSYLKQDKNGTVYCVPENASEAEKAVTEYKVIKESESKNISLLDISIKTGKKNQIRAALKDAGHPIAGDKKYGASSNPLKRLGLHACRLTVKHPFSGKVMSFNSKAPKEIREC